MGADGSRIPRRHREDLLAWAIAVASIAVIGWANGSLLDPPALLHLSDEGYIQAVAIRMVDGGLLPYVDGVGHRGPLLYLTAAFGTLLFGRADWTAMRALGLAAMTLSALGAFLAGRAAGRSWAGAVGALAVAFVGLCALYPADGMSFNGEYLLDVFAMGGLWATARGLGARADQPRLRLLALAGAFAALGALSKQSGAVLAPTLGWWVIAAAVTRPDLERRRRGAMLLAFAGGCAAPCLLVLARYALAGELDALVYYGWTYNVDVYMQTLTAEVKRAAAWRWIAERAVIFAVAGALVLWGLSRPLAGGVLGLLRRWDEEGFTPTVGLGALLSLVACNSTLRGFAHYYVQVVPWFGLLAGLLLDRALPPRRPAPRRATVARAVVVAPLLLVAAASFAARVDVYQQAQARIRQQARAWCATIDEHAPRGAPLFVWGFRPDLYVWCERAPASRFVYTTFVAGFVPWATTMSKAEEDRFASPGSRRLLVSELERAKPPVIVDAGASLAGRGLLRYELIADHVRQHYCLVDASSDMPLWVRRTAGTRCARPNSPATTQPSF